MIIGVNLVTFMQKVSHSLHHLSQHTMYGFIDKTLQKSRHIISKLHPCMSRQVTY